MCMLLTYRVLHNKFEPQLATTKGGCDLVKIVKKKRLNVSKGDDVNLARVWKVQRRVVYPPTAPPDHSTR